jgi:selenide,water dikinase
MSSGRFIKTLIVTMQLAPHPIVKDLVLVGGGHSHAITLKMFGMNPLPGVRLTLITDMSHTPYSGMLPGYVAGFYSFDECHIDLRRLAQFAQAQLYIDTAVGLDLENNRVLCANHPPVTFDLLSIDIGSTPAKQSVPGAAKYAIPAKPVSQFLHNWNQVVDRVAQNPQKPISLGIVGGGAGGVELSMTMQHHLHQVLKNADQPVDNLTIHLFHRGAELTHGKNPWVRRHLQNILLERGVELHLQESVCEVLPQKIICESGLIVESDYTFWVTTAAAPHWIAASGIETDSKGFILVDDQLRSLSHPHVFAAGDIATMANHPRPKAGVFAVRQGKPLFQNLQRTCLEKPLKAYKPQKRYLSLIGTGDGNCIASWGAFGWQSRWLWHWKDYIDRKFMEQFSDLPEMSERQGSDRQSQISPESIPNTMHCRGCGSKVGSSVLQRVLQRLQAQQGAYPRNDILMGLDTPDDCAVLQVPPNRVMVQTIDYFPALINDPFVFGQICTNHCLSDIFAMGATPQSALAVVTVPYAKETKVEETLYQLLSGAMKVLYQAQTTLVGGHTTEGAELAFGLTCNGLADPDKLLRKDGMKPEQVLILTKALGTGTLFAADMRRLAKGRWIDDAVESMLLSNQAAAGVFVEYGATACTDVTGFGLLGHLLEMVQASGVAVELDLAAIPVLEGAQEMVQQGITSSLHPQNLRSSAYLSTLSTVSDRSTYPLLFDPQTAGGLLATIPAEQATACLIALKAQGYTCSRIIGRILPMADSLKPIKILS